MTTMVRGGIISGVVLFVWGMASWMWLPWHQQNLYTVGNADQVTEMLVPNLTRKGIYTIPGSSDRSEAAMQQTKNGPMIFIAMSPAGVDPMPVSMVRGFCIQAAAGFLITFLLQMSAMQTFLRRWLFVVLTAFFAGIVTYVPEWNWWGFPSSYTLINMADLLIGWGIAGLFLAGITANKQRA